MGMNRRGIRGWDAADGRLWMQLLPTDNVAAGHGPRGVGPAALPPALPTVRRTLPANDRAGPGGEATIGPVLREADRWRQTAAAHGPRRAAFVQAGGSGAGRADLVLALGRDCPIGPPFGDGAASPAMARPVRPLSLPQVPSADKDPEGERTAGVTESCWTATHEPIRTKPLRAAE